MDWVDFKFMDTSTMARRWPVGSDLLSSGTSLPSSVRQLADHDLLSLEGRINGLWTPSVENPIEIPSRPTYAYYQRFSVDFLRSYFYKNLFKCLLTCRILQHHISSFEEIIDLGAGSGVFAIACDQIASLKKIEIVDRSSRQLEASKSVFQKLGPIAQLQFKRVDFRELDVVGKNILSSYSLSEAIGGSFDIVDLIFGARTATIVESPSFVNGIYPHLKKLGLRILAGVVDFEASDETSHLIEGGGGRFAYLHCSGLKDG